MVFHGNGVKKRTRQKERQMRRCFPCVCESCDFVSEAELSPLVDVSEVELMYLYIEALDALPNRMEFDIVFFFLPFLPHFYNRPI